MNDAWAWLDVVTGQLDEDFARTAAEEPAACGDSGLAEFCCSGWGR